MPKPPPGKRRGLHAGHAALDAGETHDVDGVGRGERDAAGGPHAQHAVAGVPRGRERLARCATSSSGPERSVSSSSSVASICASPCGRARPRPAAPRRARRRRTAVAVADRVRGGGVLDAAARCARGRPSRGGRSPAPRRPRARPRARASARRARATCGVTAVLGRASCDHGEHAVVAGHGERHVPVAQIGQQLQVVGHVGEMDSRALGQRRRDPRSRSWAQYRAWVRRGHARDFYRYDCSVPRRRMSTLAQ